MKYDQHALAKSRDAMRRLLASFSHILRRLNDRRHRFIVMPETASELSMIEQVRGQPNERE
jgi:hypothetical protein